MTLLSKFRLGAVFLMAAGPLSTCEGLREGEYQARFAKESIEAQGTIQDSEVRKRNRPRWGSDFSHLLKVHFDVPDDKPVEKFYEVSPGFYASRVKEGEIVNRQVPVRYLADAPWESAP